MGDWSSPDEDDVSDKFMTRFWMTIVFFVLAMMIIVLWFFIGPPSWPDHSTWMG